MKKVRFQSDITCMSCESNIKKILKKNKVDVVVNVPLQLIDVTFDEKLISEKEIKEKIQSIGYKADETF